MRHLQSKIFSLVSYRNSLLTRRAGRSRERRSVEPDREQGTDPHIYPPSFPSKGATQLHARRGGFGTWCFTIWTSVCKGWASVWTCPNANPKSNYLRPNVTPVIKPAERNTRINLCALDLGKWCLGKRSKHNPNRKHDKSGFKSYC